MKVQANEPTTRAYVTRYDIQGTPLFVLAIQNHGQKKHESQIEIRSYNSSGKVVAFTKNYTARSACVETIQAEMEKFIHSTKFAKLCEQFDVLSNAK